MKFIVFTLAQESRNPDIGEQLVAINPAQVSSVVSMGNTDTSKIVGVAGFGTYVVLGTFDEVVDKLKE